MQHEEPPQVALQVDAHPVHALVMVPRQAPLAQTSYSVQAFMSSHDEPSVHDTTGASVPPGPGSSLAFGEPNEQAS